MSRSITASATLFILFLSSVCFPGPELPDDTKVSIRVTSPKRNARIKSPLRVRGVARGAWFDEASFPIRLLDADGRELAVAQAYAQRDWLTEGLVPFDAVLEFNTPAGASGTLVFEPEDPSGLSEQVGPLRVPVRFRKAKAGDS